MSDYDAGRLIWVLTGLTTGAFYWQGYNPFLGAILGLVVWTAAVAMLIRFTERGE